MNPPERVVIGAHVFAIDVGDDARRALFDDDALGDSTPDRLAIRLDVDRPHSVVAETLLHETMHCVWKHTSLRTEPALGDDVEERVVCSLSPLLFDMLRRNPELVDYLIDGA